MQIQPLPPSMPISREYWGVSYISSKHSLMYFGGLNDIWQFDDGARHVTEYSLTTGDWSNLTTTGPLPTPRADQCMAASEDGNTLIVYGGKVTHPSTYTSTLYILDVPTSRWTQGPDGSVRTHMACIIVGDQLLAWGGYDGNNTINGPPEIFSLTTRQW
ncbi:hypothetical protein BGX27_005970, partial [Mortierella sp. AM989]